MTSTRNYSPLETLSVDVHRSESGKERVLDHLTVVRRRFTIVIDDKGSWSSRCPIYEHACVFLLKTSGESPRKLLQTNRGSRMIRSFANGSNRARGRGTGQVHSSG